jgi:tRNA (guanine37-N1)-methyltransferase
MVFDIITIFPNIFDSYFKESIIKRAQEKNLVKINIHNLRDYTNDKHKTVDDRPYGGGPGMVMMVEPIFKAVSALRKKRAKTEKQKVILLSAKGKKFDQKIAQKFSKLNQLILICGHYEGVDERVARYIADEEISIGDYVLTGGELPAMIIVDAVTRLIPGVLGKEESLKEESFSKKGYLEYPQYTRPEIFRNWRVPKVLLSGNHEKIKKWRNRHAN